MTDRTLAVLQLIALLLAVAAVAGLVTAVIIASSWAFSVGQDFVTVTGFLIALIAGHI